jgi:hypothetical protein
MRIRSTMHIPWNTLHRRAHVGFGSGPRNASVENVVTSTAATLKRGSRSDLTSGEKRKLSFICGLWLVLAILSMARAAHSAAAPTTEHQFIKSEFVSTPGFAKDPFFPKSTRHAPPAKTNSTEVAPANINVLSLKGISGPTNHRLAIINNRTFAAGEEADMKVQGQSYHIKCVEVRDDGVLVIVNGQSQKLSLGPKL